MSHYTLHLASHVRRRKERSAAPVVQRIEIKSASDADIARRAYEKYEARGRVDGFDEQDWTAASRELVAETFGHLSSPSICPSRYAS